MISHTVGEVREHSLAPAARHVSNKLLSRQRELFDLSSDHVEQARGRTPRMVLASQRQQTAHTHSEIYADTVVDQSNLILSFTRPSSKHGRNGFIKFNGHTHYSSALEIILRDASLLTVNATINLMRESRSHS
jgi:hypothetical protein